MLKQAFLRVIRISAPTISQFPFVTSARDTQMCMTLSTEEPCTGLCSPCFFLFMHFVGETAWDTFTTPR